MFRSLCPPQAGGEPESAWVRFLGDGGSLSGLTLEAAVEIHTVAGRPAKWAVSIVDWAGPANGGGAGAGAGAGGGGGGASQVTENLGVLACGAALCLEIEAQDAHQNRWVGRGREGRAAARRGWFARMIAALPGAPFG